MFSLSAHLDEQVAAYLAVFPDEYLNLSVLIAQLKAGAGDMFSRSNMQGHITTSSLVYDRALDMVLTIDHILLQRTLQPGGHQEGLGPLWESSKRETGEETGAESEVHPWHARTGAPLDIDTHEIGAQPSKNEGDHLHHDFIYLFTGDATKPLVPQRGEVSKAKWLSRAEFRALPGYRFPRLVRKLEMVYGLSV
jgi:8-oxo-dGTP pyrophosphatase MutT (NUDIX family)